MLKLGLGKGCQVKNWRTMEMYEMACSVRKVHVCALVSSSYLRIQCFMHYNVQQEKKFMWNKFVTGT